MNGKEDERLHQTAGKVVPGDQLAGGLPRQWPPCFTARADLDPPPVVYRRACSSVIAAV